MKRKRKRSETYRAIAAATGFNDPKTVKRILDRAGQA
jgi:hypothetical protein